jgi:hypothetical protein
VPHNPYASTSLHPDLIKHRRTRSRNGLFRQRELRNAGGSAPLCSYGPYGFTFLDKVSIVGVCPVPGSRNISPCRAVSAHGAMSQQDADSQQVYCR